MKWSSSLCYNNFCSKTGTGDKIKYYRLPNNPNSPNEYQNDFNENWYKLGERTHLCRTLDKRISRKH